MGCAGCSAHSWDPAQCCRARQGGSCQSMWAVGVPSCPEQDLPGSSALERKAKRRSWGEELAHCTQLLWPQWAQFW